MTQKTSGLHHITALASDPQRNAHFYTRVLGLRLIKKTVNFDDPETYHLYFGDTHGHPGTILTFFPHPLAKQGRHGVGQAVEISFAIPEQAFGFWINRLHEFGIPFQGPETRFGQKLVRFQDQDGQFIELIACKTTHSATTTPWIKSTVPPDMAIIGFHSTTLWVSDHESIDSLLVSGFGYQRDGNESDRIRYYSDMNEIGHFIEVRHLPGFWRGAPSAGTIHHIALRAKDMDQLVMFQSDLKQAGYHVTETKDRSYFQSIYFREKNGILFEVATDTPGFTVDEPLDHLGQSLQLPPQYHAIRDSITAHLPPLDVT